VQENKEMFSLFTNFTLIISKKKKNTLRFNQEWEGSYTGSRFLFNIKLNQWDDCM
jgi:hypothetical protein